MRSALLLPLLLAACDDYLLPPPGGTDTGPVAEGWCGVQSIFNAECVACHSSSGALAGLDLQTDPYAAIVGVAAPSGDGTLVVVGDSAGSLLYRKVAGTQSASEGGTMPPGPGLAASDVAVIKAWIDGGASDVCSGGVDTDVGTHHPTGFSDPVNHGPAAKRQTEACVTCHGADLTGQGNAVSCDSCHDAGWRTDCTFCHGDPAEGSGSPPRHLSGVDDGAAATFVPHRRHTDTTVVHTAFDCTACHAKPTDVLSPGHVFVGDSTPGHAETNFTASLSDKGVWDRGTGTCSNLYCHGSKGLDNGTRVHTSPIPDTTCSACHADRSSGFASWGTKLGGRHQLHLSVNDGGNVQCWECHGASVDASMHLLDVPKHVNGTPEVQLRAGMTMSGRTCTGTCHGELHDAGRTWP